MSPGVERTNERVAAWSALAPMDESPKESAAVPGHHA